MDIEEMRDELQALEPDHMRCDAHMAVVFGNMYAMECAAALSPRNPAEASSV